MDLLRVLIVDDHPMFREGLETVLGCVSDIEVVGAVGSGEEAVEAAGELQPDVVVMDLQMPGVNGVDATSRIVATSPHIAVLMLTMFDDDDSVFAAMRAGARGYLLKDSARSEIVRAVQAVGEGQSVFGPAIASRVIAYFLRPASALPPGPFPQLTGREVEVLELLAGGQGNQSIARRLGLSPKTVRNHVSNVFTKLQVADRAEAIVRAREAGLGQSSSGRG